MTHGDPLDANLPCSRDLDTSVGVWDGSQVYNSVNQAQNTAKLCFEVLPDFQMQVKKK